MQKKVLVLDIDGTLTNSKKEISAATREALIQAQRRGHILVLASGRPTGGLRMFLDELELAHFGGYTISYNGACVTSIATGEDIYKKALPDYAAQWMQAYAHDHEMGMCIYDGCTVVCGTRMDEYLEREAFLNRFDDRITQDLTPYMRRDIYKVLLTAQPDVAIRHEEKLARRFQGRLSIYRSEPFFIEVMACGINKGDAIAGLLERLHMEREDVIACGDGLNDLTMISYAGLGVAMGNAQPQVKAAADVITRTNDEDGLIPIIERYMLCED